MNRAVTGAMKLINIGCNGFLSDSQFIQDKWSVIIAIQFASCVEQRDESRRYINQISRFTIYTHKNRKMKVILLAIFNYLLYIYIP